MDILQALQNVPPPPCVGCVHIQRCAERQHACMSFYLYVEHGRFPKTLRRMPNSKWNAACDSEEVISGRLRLLLKKRVTQRLVERNKSIKKGKNYAVLEFVRTFPEGIASSVIGEWAHSQLGLSRNYHLKILRALRDQGRATVCGESEPVNKFAGPDLVWRATK